MRTQRVVVVVAAMAVMAVGCAAPKVDFAKISPPARAAELDEYNAFVGNWTWEADVLNAEGQYKCWKGTAAWQWILDQRCLRGDMSASSGDKSFQMAGTWSWHPKHKRYIWSTFNNWGYPQEGTAAYDKKTKTWKMPFHGVGLDGSLSFGCYCMKVVDNDTLEWTLQEWMDGMHLIKKLEMKGTYKRAK